MRFSVNYRVLLNVALILFVHSGFAQQNQKPNLEFDHVLFFVNDDFLKDSLDQLFTPAEKLTTEHKNQGTVGYYYLFYNTYIELLFLKDSAKADLNKVNFGSDYLSRWYNDEKHNPIGIGMLMSPWDTSLINDNFHIYRSDDSPAGEFYLLSKDNNDLSQPMIYVSQPHRAYDSLESFEEIEDRPEEIREDLRNYLTHNCGVRKLTHVKYSHSNKKEEEGNLNLLKESTGIQVEYSEMTAITLVFDDGSRNVKEQFRLGDSVRLIIEY